MRAEEDLFEGRIVSTQLGEFANTGIVYGFISVEISPNKSIVVKIDSYTEFDSLEIGENVAIHAARLGTTGILVAKRVNMKQATNLEEQNVGVLTAA
jgi:hypothetical protein